MAEGDRRGLGWPGRESRCPGSRRGSPNPTDKDTVNILVLGESSAFGVPYQDWLSLAEIVAWKTTRSHSRPAISPSRPGQARTDAGQDSFLDDEPAAPSGPRHPLLPGHNEFDSRYDWSHAAVHYADEMPPRRVTLESFARDHSPLCRLIQQTVGIYRIDDPAAAACHAPVGGRPGVHGGRVRRAAARLSHPAGSHGVLLRAAGCPGRAWCLRRAMMPTSSRIVRSCLRGRRGRSGSSSHGRSKPRRQSEGPTRSGRSPPIVAFLARQPGFAEAHYRLARLLEAAGQRDEANQHYVAARDCDGFPMRCTSDFLDAYPEVAARHPRSFLVDGPEVLPKTEPPRHGRGRVLRRRASSLADRIHRAGPGDPSRLSCAARVRLARHVAGTGGHSVRLRRRTSGWTTRNGRRSANMSSGSIR